MNHKYLIALVLSSILIFSSCNSKIDDETKERYLNSIHEVYSGLTDLDGHNHVNLVQLYEEFVDVNAPKTIQMTINETEETFIYDETIRYSINDKIIHRYHKENDADKKISVDENGRVNSIHYKYVTFEIDSNASAEELQPLVEKELNKWVDVSKYDSVEMERSESSGDFGKYEYCYYNYVDGYILDFTRITIHDDGSISHLNINNCSQNDVELNIDKKLESKLLDLKLEYIFDTDTSKYKSYHQVSTPQIVTYNNELYIRYSVAADYLNRDTRQEMSSWALDIIVPLELLSEK